MIVDVERYSLLLFVIMADDIFRILRTVFFLGCFNVPAIEKLDSEAVDKIGLKLSDNTVSISASDCAQ